MKSSVRWLQRAQSSCARRLSRVGFFAVCGLYVAQASAQTEAIRIEYRAAPGCPSAEEFTAEVMKRTASARLAESDARVRTFIVEIEARRAGLTGSLRVREARSETVAREVQGARCVDVASTLALATSLAIDPRSSAPSTSPAVNGAAGESVGNRGKGNDASSSDGVATDVARASAPAGAGNEESDENSRSGRSASAPAETSPSDGPRARHEDGPPRDSLGAGPDEMRQRGGARIVLGLGPSLMAGVTPPAALGVSISATWSNRRAGAWLSSYGADVTWLRAPGSETAGATATFQLLYARPAICAIRLGGDDGISLSPCLGAELGMISGWGSNLPLEERHTKLWAALELFARVRIGVKNDWSLEAQAGPSLPLTRYEFLFRSPDTEVHTVSRVALAAGVRVGLPLNH